MSIEIATEYARIKALAEKATPNYALVKHASIEGVQMYWLVFRKLSIGVNNLDDAPFLAAAPDMIALIDKLMAERVELRAELENIVRANWREWDDLASADNFVDWAKSRASAILAKTEGGK